jgi:hypothetical protein
MQQACEARRWCTEQSVSNMKSSCKSDCCCHFTQVTQHDIPQHRWRSAKAEEVALLQRCAG